MHAPVLRSAASVALAVATVSAGLVLAAPSAHAAPPPNDELAGATTIAVGEPVAVELAGATLRTDPQPEYLPCAPGAGATGSVGFELTPGQAGAATARLTLPSDEGGAMLAIYEGPADATEADLTALDCRRTDEEGRRLSSELDLEQGAHYYLQVAASDEVDGAVLDVVAPPANDAFASPTVVTGASGTLPHETLAGATREPDESTPARRSVWYRWTAPTSGFFRFDTAGVDGAEISTTLTAYFSDELGDSLTDVVLAATDYPTSARAARIGFRAAEGQTFIVLVGAPDGATTDDFALTWTAYEPHATRIEVQAEVDGSAVTLAATVSRLDGTAVPQGQLRVSENGFTRRTVPLVGGQASTTLRNLSGSPTFTVAFARGSLDDLGSSTRVTVTLPRAGEPPVNDDVQDATDLTGPAGTAAGTLRDATLQPRELRQSSALGTSVWWRWTPGTSGNASFGLSDGTSGADDDTRPRLDVYRGDPGDSLDELLRVGASSPVAPDDTATVRVPLLAGRTYYVRADAVPVTPGSTATADDVTLTWEAEPADPATDVELAAATASAHTVGLEATFAEPVSGDVTFWDGDRLVAFEQADGATTTRAVDRGVGPGPRTYRVELWPFDDATPSQDEASVDVPRPTAPGNDLFADAAELDGADGSAPGTSVGATSDPGTPPGALGYDTADATAWWRWVAPSDGPVAFRAKRTERSGDPVLRAYEDVDADAAAPSDLRVLTANDDVPGANGSSAEVAFNAVRGHVYYLALDAYSLATTSGVVLSWRPVPPTSSSATTASAALAGRDLVLSVDASVAGWLEVRERDVAVAYLPVTGGPTTVHLDDVAYGTRPYTVVLVPDDPAVAPSSATTDPVRVAARTRTTLDAPSRAPAGARPTVRVRVTAPGTAPRVVPDGRVQVVVGGRSLGRVRLEDGRLRLRLPRLEPGRNKVLVEYLGSGSTKPSRATRTIRVRR